MAGYTAVADVGDTLVSLLRDRMDELLDEEEIALASPAELEERDDLRLTLFLYDVTENEHLKNDPPRGTDAETTPGSPLVLELSYLLTAHPSTGGNDPWTTRTKEEHTVLGRAMQVLSDNAIVSGPDLVGSLDGGDRLHVSIDRSSPDHVLDVWNTFQETPYRPSVSYVVTPVVVDAARDRDVTRVVETERQGYTFDHRVGGEE